MSELIRGRLVWRAWPHEMLVSTRVGRGGLWDEAMAPETPALLPTCPS